MFETVVTLKPHDQWRPGMTWEKLIAEMNEHVKTPGMANIFWMPIQTRTEMLTTGFRSILGIKVFGADLKQIENVAVEIEKALSDFPNTRSAFAERTTGGYFLDFEVNREAAARYGLRVGDVNEVIETAIGGKTIATTVEGRERYPISVRYARDFRDDLDSLKRVLVATRETGRPLFRKSPSRCSRTLASRPGRRRSATRTASSSDLSLSTLPAPTSKATCRPRRERIHQRVKFPAGYYMQWAGQFEYLKAAEARLKIVMPFTLLIIFVLIYMNTQSAVKTMIVLLAVPFSLVGAFWDALPAWLQP